jgi:ATP-binding cassette subfamily G (WHITE) protein 2
VIECLSQLSQRGRKLLLIIYIIQFLLFKDTIIISIHQPRYSIFKLVDNLFLIGAGRCIYHGSVHDVLPFFSSIGLTCEEHDNPADFILDVCQGVRNISYPLNDIDKGKDQICQYLHDVFIKSSIYDSISQQIQEANNLSDGPLNKQVELLSRSYLIEMWYVSQRAFRNSFRNSTLMIMQTIVPICLAILVGFLYMNTDNTVENGVKNRLGAIFFIVSNEVFLNLSALELFMKERILFAHENASGYYRVSTYFISKLLCDIILLRFIPSIVFSLISYFMIQFQRTIQKFLIYQLAIFATAVCSASVCFFVSASVGSIGEIDIIDY